MFTLTAKARTGGEKMADLREEGLIPAVFYGAGTPSTPISIPMVDFIKVWREAGESATISITLGTTKVDALIHDLQLEPVKNVPIHVDFLVVDMNKEITVSVPLEFIGESEAVKAGAVLVKVLHEVEVTALPKDLPQHIEVDISSLAQVDDQIHVSDLKAPAQVTIATPGEEVVVLASPAQEETEEESTPTDLSAIEVEQKGKKEDEETSE